MRRPELARTALDRAEQVSYEIDRSLWLAKAADHVISDRAVLVGGPRSISTPGMYNPTDVDLCAYLDEAPFHRRTSDGDPV